IPFYVANLKSWDVILGEPALTELDAIMDIRHNATSIKPKHQPRMELQMMQRSGDIDRVISAAQWMQPTAETDNDSGDQCKDYAYDETDYEDSDSELEEGEIREENPDEQNLINLQEEGEIREENPDEQHLNN